MYDRTTLMAKIAKSKTEEVKRRTQVLTPPDGSIRRHRGLIKETGIPVTGYVWHGVDHTYIIPHTCGAGYDDDKRWLNAHAVEVDPATVAVELGRDDNNTPLFENDLVRIGEDEFLLRPFQLDVMDKLRSYERRKKGLFRVKPNYQVAKEKG